MSVPTPDRASGAATMPNVRGSRACQECGAPIEGRLERKWCGDACRMRASRRRKARELADLVARMRRLIGG